MRENTGFRAISNTQTSPGPGQSVGSSHSNANASLDHQTQAHEIFQDHLCSADNGDHSSAARTQTEPNANRSTLHIPTPPSLISAPQLSPSLISPHPYSLHLQSLHIPTLSISNLSTFLLSPSLISPHSYSLHL